MIDGRRIMALIPARGGSKRLPRKNVLPLGGRPLISWSIQAAQESEYVDKVFVSTDDDEIRTVASDYDACLLQKRPKILATDQATTVNVALFSLAELEKEDLLYDYILLLQPTSPLRTALHIDEAIELCMKKQADCIISVTELEHPVEWINELPEDLSMNEFFPRKWEGLGSQSYPKRFRINGSIYLCKVKPFLTEKSFFFRTGSYAYTMDRRVSIDIDEATDLLIAEALIDATRQ